MSNTVAAEHGLSMVDNRHLFLGGVLPSERRGALRDWISTGGRGSLGSRIANKVIDATHIDAVLFPYDWQSYIHLTTLIGLSRAPAYCQSATAKNRWGSFYYKG